MQQPTKIGWVSAGAIVVANMIGTGAFTTLGFQLRELQNTWAILSLWGIGGMVALFGAFSYAELGARLPKSGGEYHFLSYIFHPFVGYLSGWVSLTVGFAASISLSAMAMGDYTQGYTWWTSQQLAVGVIIVISLIHSFSLRRSSHFQNIFTLLKVLLVMLIIALGLSAPAQQPNALDWSAQWVAEVPTPAYAISLVYVLYAFSGWNAAAYIVEEIRMPARNLPRALIWGTLLVSVLYVLLQWAFLRQASLPDLSARIDVGHVVAENMFGIWGGKLVSGMIALLLIAGISAMIWVGPRVTRAMAEQYPAWRFFAHDNRAGIPVRAIFLQSGISIFMVLTGSFEQILLYSGFVLHLFTTLTVAGLLVLRFREGTSPAYQSPFFPIAQIIFLAISGWMLVFLLFDKPQESLFGLVNLLLGTASYKLNRWLQRQ